MAEEMNTILTATVQPNEGEKKDVFIPVRTSEYRELVELATTYKMKYEEANAQYWNGQSRIRELETQLKEIKEATE